MKRLKENFHKPHILIIGAGIIGKFNAIELSELGYQITIVDPLLKKNSSSAALGLLMGNIYQKRIGRSWMLRKESLQLWPKWINFLGKIDKELTIEKPLIQLTKNIKKFDKLKKFVEDNPRQGLEVLEENSTLIKNINNTFKTQNIKGIISHEDGRVDPELLLNSLDIYLKEKKIKFINTEVIKIEKLNKNWISTFKNNDKVKSDGVLICNSLNAVNLICKKTYEIRLKPVLGQAIEITADKKEIDFSYLPKHFNIDGINIIPLSKDKIIIGSTDEYCEKPEENVFERLTSFLEYKPQWLSKEKITRKWFGIRARPDGEPSPIQKNLDDGLILCTGFYKNGFLLAPACSQWVANELEKFFL